MIITYQHYVYRLDTEIALMRFCLLVQALEAA